MYSDVFWKPAANRTFRDLDFSNLESKSSESAVELWMIHDTTRKSSAGAAKSRRPISNPGRDPERREVKRIMKIRVDSLSSLLSTSEENSGDSLRKWSPAMPEVRVFNALHSETFRVAEGIQAFYFCLLGNSICSILLAIFIYINTF